MSMHVMRSVNLYTCIYSEIKVNICKLMCAGINVYGIHLSFNNYLWRTFVDKNN